MTVVREISQHRRFVLSTINKQHRIRITESVRGLACGRLVFEDYQTSPGRESSKAELEINHLMDRMDWYQQVTHRYGDGSEF